EQRLAVGAAEGRVRAVDEDAAGAVDGDAVAAGRGGALLSGYALRVQRPRAHADDVELRLVGRERDAVEAAHLDDGRRADRIDPHERLAQPDCAVAVLGGTVREVDVAVAARDEV